MAVVRFRSIEGRGSRAAAPRRPQRSCAPSGSPHARSRGSIRFAALAPLLAAVLFAPRPADASERLHRVLDQGNGLPTDTVSDVAQDADGFIWIATPGGLVRFDGDEMRRWDPQGRGIQLVTLAASGLPVVLDADGRLYRANPNGGLDPLAGPDGAAIQDVRDARFAPSGALWMVRTAGLARRSPDGAWLRVTRERFDFEPLLGVRPDGPDDALVLTQHGIWSVSGGGRVERITAIHAPADVVRRPDGSLVTLAGESVVLVQDGVPTPLFTIAARPIDLKIRQGSIWAAYDRFVVRLAPGEPPAVIGPESGLPAGGRMLVDREGSLWICSFRGLMQFPEPDTVMWSERDGLPSSHARFLGLDADGLWISTWGGLARMDRTAQAPERLPTTSLHIGEVCLDAGGGLWYADGGALMERRDGRVVRHRKAQGYFRFCTPTRDGAVWLGLGSDLVRAGPAGAASVAGPPAASPGALMAPLLEDRAGRLWIWFDGRLCRASVPLSGSAGWTCETLPGRVSPVSMVETGGTIWLATGRDGIFRRADAGWEPIPASRALGGGGIFKLRPGADGSVWVLSLGRPTRVVDRPGTAGGWEVVEIISAWHGQPSGGASDLIEEADGTVWTATAAGLVRVPAHARRAPFAAPAVRLAGLFVDGQSVPVDRPLRLAHRLNLVEMRFAALTFRDRNRLRYQVRLSSESGWLDLTSGGPVFRYPSLPAGDYVADVRATIDGRAWSDEGPRLAFQVDGPWYFRPWFVALLIVAAAALLAAIHRARLRMALRLERQRTGIAMDLHDEIGSGLGSIGILAGIADARTAAGKEPGLLREIAETAADLSASLGDIVWSLRSGERTMQELAGHIAERGHRLFPGESTTFVMHAPDGAPADRLSLAAGRSVLLIVLEALHNAARHAGARRVEAGFARDGTLWRVWVADDGKGFDTSAEAAAGLGSSSMRRRAEQIEADLRVDSRPGGGTVVSLVFDPRVRDGRPPRMRMRGARGGRGAR